MDKMKISSQFRSSHARIPLVAVNELFCFKFCTDKWTALSLPMEVGLK